MQLIVHIEFLFTICIQGHLVEENVRIYQTGIDIDNHITIHMTTIIAAAIDISTNKTSVQVIRSRITTTCICDAYRCGRTVFHTQVRIDVPLQLWPAILQYQVSI